MKKIILFVIAVMQIFLAGCASKPLPDINDMQKLGLDEVKSLIPGNTATFLAVWGRWAEYYRVDNTGYASTWSDLLDFYGWQADEATFTYEFTDKAEICRRYSGDSPWAKPELTYCSMIYLDDGQYYIIDTQNPSHSEFIGVANKLEIEKGDHYRLSDAPEAKQIYREN